MKRALTLFRFALLLSPLVTQAALMSGNCNGTPKRHRYLRLSNGS